MFKIILFFAVLAGGPEASVGQSLASDATQLTEIHSEIDSIKRGQEAIQKELSIVADILSGKRPPLDHAFVGTAGSPSLGKSDAKATIVEFTDFQCPFCGAYARETFKQVVHEYVDTGKLRYVIKQFPIEQLHPFARGAAEASLCANDQGKFWELHERLFANQAKLAPGDMPAHGAAVAVEPVAFQECIVNGTHAAQTAGDLKDGHALQVKGTPTFFIGYIDPTDPSRIRAVRLITGNAPYGEFQRAIAEVISLPHPGEGAAQ